MNEEFQHVDFKSLIEGDSFKDVVLMKDGQLDLSRFQALMKGVVEETSKKTDVPAHKLVRIVRNGRVQWTTVQEARKMAQFHRKAALSEDSDAIANEIEKAINGDINTLEDELLILLCMAGSGGGSDSLDKCRMEILEKSSEIRESEIDLNRRKHETGIIDTFEEKLGLMINYRNSGNEKRASELANELRKQKKKYMLYSRSLEPSLQKIRWLRTELLRTKEKIVETMLDAVRKDSKGISFTSASLSQNVQKLEETYKKMQESNKEIDPKSLATLKERLNKMQTALESKKEEAEAISLQESALQKELDNTRAAAQQLDQGSNLGSAIEEQVEKNQNLHKIDTKPSPTIAPQRNASRMSRASD